MQDKQTGQGGPTAKTRAVVNMKSRIWRNGVRIDRRRKPQCVAVRIGRKVRVIGQSAAAKWLGMSRTTLVAAVEGRKDIAAETVALVRREYPELFVMCPHKTKEREK